MKKALSILLVLLMVFSCVSLAACGDSKKKSNIITSGSSDKGESTKDEAANTPIEEITESVDVSADVMTDWDISEGDLESFGNAIKLEANGSPINLKVWGPEAAQDVLKQQAEDFEKLFAGYATINIDVKVQGENDAARAVISDAYTAADVFGFASDQIDTLVSAGAISEVLFRDEVSANNSAASVVAATKNGKIYGYPETGDNSYILVYDKRLVSEEQAKSFEGVLDACKAAGKNFVMDAKNGFFSCMFLYTGGLETQGFEADGYTQKFNNYDINKVTASVKAFADLFKSAGSTFVSADTTRVNEGFKNNTAAAGIAGSWNMAAIKETLGDNAGYAIIPTININGTATQTINMLGYKFLGVNSQSKYPGTAQVLAYYLTNYKCQMERAEMLDWTPCNIEAQNSAFVRNNPSMVALMEQSYYSVPQTAIAATFWDSLAALGTYMLQGGSDLSTKALKTEVAKTIACIRDEG